VTGDVREPLPPMPVAWWRGALVGGLLATLLFGYVLLVGHAGLTAAPTGDFYDLQTRAWFDGRWDIEPFDDDRGAPVVDAAGNPVTPLSIEAIVVDGRAYLYYGPVPSLLRVPLLALTDDLDGETSQPAMLAAFGVALAAVTVLHWRIRALVRGPDAGLGRRGAVLSGLVTFGVGAGSVLLYLASQPTVYHEANLWGLAFALCAFAALLRLQTRPTVRAVAWAGGWTTLALLSRASVGVGPLVALGLVAGAMAWRWWSSHSGPSPRRGSGRVLAALGVACVLPVVLYAGVNLAKFGEPFRLPLEKQVFSQIDEQRQAALDANGGSLFGLAYLPSTTWQYLRPDALEIDDLAPWITFPREPATVIGDATFDTRDESSSIPATMPLWTVLAVVGAVAVVRRGVLGRDAVRFVVLPVAGAAAGVAGVLVIGFIAHRYLGDALPLLLLLALTGLQVVAGWVGRQQVAIGRLVMIDLALLGVLGVAVNGALAIEYQRLIAPVEPSTRTDFVVRQLAWAGGAEDRADTIRDVAELRDVDGERGDLRLVVAEGQGCVGAVWSDGFSWIELPDGARVCAALAPSG
jgi:hypothetical protein